MTTSEDTDVRVPRVAVDLGGALEHLADLVAELDHYSWESLVTAHDDGDRRYHVRLWVAQLTARRALLKDVARRATTPEVVVTLPSLGDARALLDAFAALETTIDRDDVFEAVYEKVARALTAADRIAGAINAPSRA